MKKLLTEIFKISPDREEEKIEFSKYRNDDVGHMFNYVLAFTVAAAIIVGLAWLSEPDIFSLTKFLGQFFIMLVFAVTWLIGNKIPDKYALIIAGGITVVHLVTTITIDLVIVEFGGTFIGMQSRIGGIFIYSLILAPSMKYMCFYIAIFYVNIIQVILRHVDEEQ